MFVEVKGGKLVGGGEGLEGEGFYIRLTLYL